MGPSILWPALLRSHQEPGKEEERRRRKRRPKGLHWASQQELPVCEQLP